MSIRAIEPKYKDWVKGINMSTITAKTAELNNEFNAIIHDILYSNMSNQKINERISDTRKRLLYVQLAYNQMKGQSAATTEQLAKLSDSMNLITQYENRETQANQKKSLNILTYISIIVLPLTLITSYFGMNFGSMGAIAERKGVLSMRWGQVFVIGMGVVSVIAAILILNHYYTVKN
jgi:Mg2+ and Co2+ transporter CorA